jgi:hypothetical protein
MEAVAESDWARVDALVKRALRELGAPAHRLSIRIVPDSEAVRDGRLLAAGCATVEGIELWRGALAWPEDELEGLVWHEAAHHYLLRRHPRVRGEVWQEAFASFVVASSLGVEEVVPKFDLTSYHCGQLVGQAAAAGDVELAIAALAAGHVRPLTALPGLARELAEAQGPAEFAAVLDARGGTNELRPRARP